MNENFEKLEFNSEASLYNNSFYIFTKMPILNPTFSDFFSLNFNLNNLINFNKGEEIDNRNGMDVLIESQNHYVVDLTKEEDFYLQDMNNVNNIIDLEDCNYLENYNYDYDYNSDNILNDEIKNTIITSAQDSQFVIEKNISKQSFNNEINNIIKINKLDTKLTNDFELRCPNYDNYSEDKLKDEIKNYGMKTGTVKNMIKQLKDIWEFINTKRMPNYIKNDLNNFMLINDEFNISKKKDLNDDDNKKGKIVEVIKDNFEIWSQILKFKKVDLKEIKDIINKKGIIIEIERLRLFLGELGVIFK